MCGAKNTFWVEKAKTFAAVALTLWVAFAVATPAPLLAQDDPFETLNDAEINALIELLEGAREEESNRNWSEALDLYRAAEALAPLDEYTYRQAVCLERLERYREALQMYLELSETGSPEAAASASERLVELESVIAAIPVRLSISSEPSGATVWIDGVNLGQTAEQALAVDVLPGAHGLQLTLAGYADYISTIEIEPLSDPFHSISLELASTPSTGSNPIPFVLLGSGGAFLTVGVIMNVLSENRATEHNENPPGGDMSLEDSQALADDAEGLYTLAVGGYIFAGVLFGAAVVTYFVLDDSPDEDDTEVMIVPAVSDNSAGAILRWEF